jgi:hypothetical protein
VAFPGRQIWTFSGNRSVEAHIHGNAQAKETELVEIDITFAVLPHLLKYRSSREPHLEIQLDLIKETERDICRCGRNSSSREFQLKESSRYKKLEEKSVEAKTSDIGHGSREVGG